MKLTLTNKKQNKNCLYFIRALYEIQKHNLKDNLKPLYLYVSKQEMRLAPSLTDFHKENLEHSCLITFKSDTYNIIFDHPVASKIILINSSKLLKAFTKNDSKVILIDLRTTNRGITVQYQSEGSDVICQINVESEEVEGDWPQHPLSTREPFYELVYVCKLSEAEIRDIDMKDEQEVWIQFIEGGLFARVLKGKIRKEGKVLFKEQADYNYMTVKNKLHNRQFVNLRGDFFLDHLWRCLKKKRTTSLLFKNICDRYLQNEIKQSYILMETRLQHGSIFKMVGCFISEQMGEEGEQAIRREIHHRQREVQKESTLLKSEQNNSQHIRNIVLNRFNQVDGQAMIGEQISKERNPIGKIEEGEETFTRKFSSKY